MFKVVRYIYYGTSNKIKYFLLILGSYFISDKQYAKIKYKKKIGSSIDLVNPILFNEKLQWIKLYDRNPMMPKLADKYYVRKYVKNKIGEQYLNDLLGYYTSSTEFFKNYSCLPENFVIKATHASGWNYFVNKNKVDKNILKKIIDKWLVENFYYYGREWAYKNIYPGILCEKIIKPININHPFPIDYRFFCFSGKPEFIVVDLGTYISKTPSKSGKFESSRERAVFDLNWDPIDVIIKHPMPNEPIYKPKNLFKMMELAKTLSKDFKFVRIDFYNENKIIFGEMTFYPGNGFQIITPSSYDYKFGKLLKL